MSPEEHVRAVARTCRGPLSDEGQTLRAAALAAGDLEGAKVVDAQHRTPCGADFNEVILSNPLDGQERAYVCPRCGVTGSYRAPRFVEDDGA